MVMKNIDNSFYDKKFVCGKVKLSRNDLESFPSPFCTKDVTDETMNNIVAHVSEELKK